MTSITASNTIQYSSDVETSTSSSTPFKVKDIAVTDSYTGSWRIVFDMWACYTGDCGYHGAWAQIYKNGEPYGTLQYSDENYGYVTKTQDFTGINISGSTPQDIIQLYAYADPRSDPVYLKNFRIEFSLGGATGNASFTSVPTGATIWIDGSNTGLNTPNTISNLSAGSHNYTLKLTGYADSTGSFSVTSGSTTTVPTVTFAPSAILTSIPSGASIYIDNISQGVNTPATITSLSIGSHTYKLSLVGYNISLGNFITTGGQTTNISTILSGTAMAFLTAGD